MKVEYVLHCGKTRSVKRNVVKSLHGLEKNILMRPKKKYVLLILDENSPKNIVKISVKEKEARLGIRHLLNAKNDGCRFNLTCMLFHNMIKKVYSSMNFSLSKGR